MIGVYVGLVFPYGALAWYAGRVPSEGLRQVLVGLMTASALLHFYYDGFIWKVRESATRRSLGLAGAEGVSLARLPGFKHTLRWAALLVPFVMLATVQLSGHAVPLLERRAAAAETVPDDAQGQVNYAGLLHLRGELEAAAARASRAVALNPNLAEAEYCLGLIRYDQLDYAQAERHYRRAIQLNPNFAEAHANLGSLLLSFQRLGEAKLHFQASLRARPKQAGVLAQLGEIHLLEGSFRAAGEAFQAALNLDPKLQPAREGLVKARSKLEQ